MSKLFIIFILIFVFSTYSIAAVFKVATTSDDSQNILTQTTPQNPTNPASSAGGNFESTDGYPIINRLTTPNYKDFNLKNSASDIKVEIQGSGRDFDNVLIREIIDFRLNISNLRVYVEDPIFSTNRTIRNVTKSIENNSIISKMLDSANESYMFCKKGDTNIYIKIPRLKSGENVIYDYRVRSNRSGIFNVVTLFRLNGSRWSDLEKRDTIEMRPPEIEVSTETDESSAIRDDFLNVTYNILHKSGWSNDELCVNLFFNNSSQYTIYYENKTLYANQLINLKLKPLETTKYPIKIKYHSAGKHPIPSLDIVGATVYQKDADVDVFPTGIEKTLQDNAPLINSLAQIITSIVLLITIFFSFDDRKRACKTENRACKAESDILEIKKHLEQNKHQEEDDPKKAKSIDKDLDDDPSP